MANCAIVGINWGDEGKGRMVDLLTEDYDVVVRFQGGGNAGHTVINEKGKFALHLLPSGIFRSGVVNILGNGVALDPENLWTEMQDVTNHFHWYKTEDIINRGGGNCLIRVYNSLPNEEIDYESDVTVHMDGRTFTVPAGTQVKLTPGESIHVQQYLYHDFAVEPGTGAVLLGEVSQCNDDNTDNRFHPPVGRFPTIEEDEAPYRLLCNEYPPAK